MLEVYKSLQIINSLNKDFKNVP